MRLQFFEIFIYLIVLTKYEEIMKTTKHYIATEKTIPQEIKNQIPGSPGSNRFYEEIYRAIEMRIGEFATLLDTGQRYFTNFLEFDLNRISAYTLRVILDFQQADRDGMFKTQGIELKL